MGARPETAKKILLYWMDGSVALLCLAYAIFTVAGMAEGTLSAVRGAAILALLVPYVVFFALALRDGYDGPRKPTVTLMVSGLLGVALLVLSPPEGLSSGMWVDTVTLWLALVALHLRPRGTLLVSAAVVAAITVYAVLTTGRAWPGVLFGTALAAAAVIATMLLWRWLWWVIRDAHRGREARARLAVAEERLRFARDLHDLLGHSLSVITLKSELAAKLATKDPDRAAAEMAEVRALAGESLFEVQQAVHGYQALDLDEELEGVRAALEAAGATCVIEARTDGLSPAARTLLAWAVREGGTNILKHSSATRCAITIDAGVLEMVNDGAKTSSAQAGSGLRGLSERLVAAGGSFSAHPTPGGGFMLRAVVPA